MNANMNGYAYKVRQGSNLIVNEFSKNTPRSDLIVTEFNKNAQGLISLYATGH